MIVLVTGASGFLGSEICRSLKDSHHVITLGRQIDNHILCDLSANIPKLPAIDVLVHAAGMAHSIPKTKEESDVFYRVNAQGTANLLKGLEQAPPKSIVFISTVAVYGVDCGKNINEGHPLKGVSAYAKSKIEAENLLREWCTAYKSNLVILRLPLISGKNPPGNLASMAKAMKRGFYFRIGNGTSRKSMVSAVSVAQSIPGLFLTNGVFNLTDGLHPSLRQIEERMSEQLKRNIIALPKWPFTILAKVGDVLPFLPINTIRLQKLTSSLTFNDDLARKALNWNPTPALDALTFSSE